MYVSEVSPIDWSQFYAFKEAITSKTKQGQPSSKLQNVFGFRDNERIDLNSISIISQFSNDPNDKDRDYVGIDSFTSVISFKALSLPFPL